MIDLNIIEDLFDELNVFGVTADYVTEGGLQLTIPEEHMQNFLELLEDFVEMEKAVDSCMKDIPQDAEEDY